MLSAVVFDMDGVLYRGSRSIKGVSGEIRRLQKKVKVLFLTNNATKSRQDYVRHLAAFGIIAKRDDVMTSSFGCARYVLEKFGRGAKVFVVGEEGLASELEREAGATLVTGKGAQVVAVGLDRRITYKKLETALSNLVNGAEFLLANSDPTFPKENGVAPGSGAIAAPLVCASGRQPDFVAGKPSDYLIRKLLQMHGIKPSEAAFVGDRLEIDVRMANAVGMQSVLVLTGIAKRKDLKNAPESDRPDIVVNSAAQAGRALGI